jgi:DNA-binding ferritin-like protein
MPDLKSDRVLKHPGSSKSRERLFESKVNIPGDRRPLIELLNAHLADAIDMQTQAKFAHWNVKGEGFYQLHLLFDSLAEHLEEAVDLIAEQITALGDVFTEIVRAADKDIYFLQSHLQVITTYGH